MENPCSCRQFGDDHQVITVAELLEIQDDGEGYFGQPAMLLAQYGAQRQVSICWGCGFVIYAEDDGTFKLEELDEEEDLEGE